jgi:hypothetical protein
MSDDDLWSRTPPPEDKPPADESEPAPEPAVSDETQPLSGLGKHSTEEPPPPGSEQGSEQDSEQVTEPGSGPGTPPAPPAGNVPPPDNPFGDTDPHGAPPPQNPYSATTPYPTAPPPYGQPYGQQPGQPYGQQPGQQYGQPPGQQGYEQYGAYPPPTNPYPQPGSFDQAHPQPGPYGAPYSPAYAGGVVPDHPSATTAMVFGILGLVGLAICQVLLFFSPVAWVMGARAVREIDANPGRYAGRDKAVAAKVMGIIGTVALVLGIAALVAFFAFAIASTGSSDL